MPWQTVIKDGRRTCTACKITKELPQFGKCGGKGRNKYFKNICKACESLLSQSRWATMDKAKRTADVRRRNWKKNFGLTPQRYAQILDEQGGSCAICRRTEPHGNGTIFGVDHCHATGMVRGLLCTSCNTGIGNLGDSIEMLERALDYLRNAEDQR